MKLFLSMEIMLICAEQISHRMKLVARALLPAEIMEGSKLKYELMQYELIG
jgi:hypothetical protein